MPSRRFRDMADKIIEVERKGFNPWTESLSDKANQMELGEPNRMVPDTTSIKESTTSFKEVPEQPSIDTSPDKQSYYYGSKYPMTGQDAFYMRQDGISDTEAGKMLSFKRNSPQGKAYQALERGTGGIVGRLIRYNQDNPDNDLVSDEAIARLGQLRSIRNTMADSDATDEQRKQAEMQWEEQLQNTGSLLKLTEDDLVELGYTKGKAKEFFNEINKFRENALGEAELVGKDATIDIIGTNEDPMEPIEYIGDRVLSYVFDPRTRRLNIGTNVHENKREALSSVGRDKLK